MAITSRFSSGRVAIAVSGALVAASLASSAHGLVLTPRVDTAIPADAPAAPGAPHVADSGATVPVAPAVTDPAEAAKVDAVDVSRFAWAPCVEPNGTADMDCATLAVPLSYAEQGAGTYTLSIAKRKAKDPAQKIGTLFINPGGPGASSVALARYANQMLSAELQAKFDIVGIDPRGVGGSKLTYCFETIEDREAATTNIATRVYPYLDSDTGIFVDEVRGLAKACNTREGDFLRHVGTANVARDMDVVRRALGEKQLSYLGFSYGTVLGQTYANMFPDRTRAMVLDGVVAGDAWYGTGDTAGVSLGSRALQAEGAEKALAQVFTACDAAGAAKCALAPGSAEKYRKIREKFELKGVLVVNKDRTYWSRMSHDLLVGLYRPDGAKRVVQSLSYYWKHLETATVPDDTARLDDQLSAVGPMTLPHVGDSTGFDLRAPGEVNRRDGGPDYYNEHDAQMGVMCGDGKHPTVDSGVAQAREARKQHPTFGGSWGWWTMPCSTDLWSGKAADGYAGPFNKSLVNPVLFMGNLWDPATNIAGAQRASETMPGSGLVVADNWGHTAYPSNKCAQAAADAYLVSGKSPGKVTCDGTPNPFAG